MIPIGEVHLCAFVKSFVKIKFQTQDGRADMTNFEMDLFDTKINSYALEKEESEQCCQHSIIKPACVPVSIISLFIFLIVFFPLFNEDGFDTGSVRYDRNGYCTDQCRLITGNQFRMQLVETIPSILIFDNSSLTSLSTYEVWKKLLDDAQVSIDVASFYWNLRDPVAHSTSWQVIAIVYTIQKFLKYSPTTRDGYCKQSIELYFTIVFEFLVLQGNDTFERFIASAERGVRIRIAQNQPTTIFPQLDSKYFAENESQNSLRLFFVGYATVRNVDMPELMDGNGILHTKFWIVDSRHVYIGSANMDWKSLTEVKELGIVIWNCTCIANDLYKIFNIYWRLGVRGAKIPYKWPLNLRTYFNFSHPLKLLSVKDASVFISSSPPQFNAKGREDDSDAIVAVMDNAHEFVHISVMDYMPATIYRTSNNNTLVSKFQHL
ncbi:unnamed protein product [Brugia timori]|uniref:PLD phosphodiesterase domain-containing protein n=1 Tax=Brugia timori TaxID=42155 RepID=A0A0R3Q4J5_9BILA|nr:unnamed protein product [Brugia timori]